MFSKSINLLHSIFLFFASKLFHQSISPTSSLSLSTVSLRFFSDLLFLCCTVILVLLLFYKICPYLCRNFLSRNIPHISLHSLYVVVIARFCILTFFFATFYRFLIFKLFNLIKFSVPYTNDIKLLFTFHQLVTIVFLRLTVIPFWTFSPQCFFFLRFFFVSAIITRYQQAVVLKFF